MLPISNVAIRDEAGELHALVPGDDVDDLFIDRQGRFREAGEVELPVPMVSIPDLLEPADEDAGLGELQASDAEEAVMRNRACLVKEDHGCRVAEVEGHDFTLADTDASSMISSASCWIRALRPRSRSSTVGNSFATATRSSRRRMAGF